MNLIDFSSHPFRYARVLINTVKLREICDDSVLEKGSEGSEGSKDTKGSKGHRMR